MRKFTFIWFIQNFSYSCHEHDEELESPTFFVKMIRQTSWNLLLYPRGNLGTDFISLFANRCDDLIGTEEIALKCKLSILDAYGRDIESLENTENECRYGAEYGSSHFYGRPVNILKDKAFTRDVLRVCCTMLVGEGEIEKEILCYAVTRIGLEKISFIIPVKNFSTPNSNQQLTHLSKPVSKNPFEASVNISIKRGSDDKVMLGITVISENGLPMTCQIYVLNSAGKEVECGRIDTRNDTSGERAFFPELNFGKRDLLDKKRDYLHNDELTLRCEFTISTGSETQGIEETFHDIHLTPLLQERIRYKIFELPTSEPKSVTGDFGSLYKDRILCDIQLETKSGIFPAHKSVLCARSPVFAQMLRTNMSEKLMDSIQIEDLDDSTIDQFLLFLYTDILEDLQWESAMKLYYAADKYNVQRLKDVCSSFLITALNIRNVSEVLILADRHQDFDLRTAVDKFFIMTHTEIFDTEEWEAFVDNEPELALEAMTFYLNDNLDLRV